MLQDCLREFSAFDGGTPDGQGRFDYPYLDAYWQEEGRSPLVFVREGNEIGFAFVRRLGEIEVEMAEFYVMPRFRRTGVAPLEDGEFGELSKYLNSMARADRKYKAGFGATSE